MASLYACTSDTHRGQKSMSNSTELGSQRVGWLCVPHGDWMQGMGKKSADSENSLSIKPSAYGYPN